ncbi:copper resistance D family protein [Methylocaldum szegediense]|uniref:Copper resistance protein D n=1 Tax=Methylocaldum szegediense TaxID=73780 RepID=A0ABM9I722_9GAMM|nr:CopD family protein [Methylocaldum szegediense]CAI8932359.1 copper resistance protein D [Methylocaldum szegediense]
MYMQGLANFIDDFLGGLILISYALVVGSLLWSAFILRVWSPGFAAHESMVRRAVTLLRAGAIALAITQGLKLVIKAVILASVLGEFPVDAYIGTVQFQAGLIRFLLSLGLIFVARQLQQTPDKASSWNLTAILIVPLVIAGAWLVHGVGRFENREPLMILTVLHQFAAAVWFGGVAQLLWLWYMSRQSPEAKAFWPVAITRFALLGVSSVVLLLLTGLPLAWTYVGSWDGLLGTGYGSLVFTKILLLMVALGFAYLNNRAGRLWLQQRQTEGLDNKVPHYIEAETFILVGILFIAATLSSQPPSVDIKELTASVSEVAEMFAPRMPRLTSPTHEQLLAGEPGRVAVVDKVPSPAATEWSDYNHNVSGIFLTVMALVAMLSYSKRFEWARYWPLGFVGLSIFLFFRSDAETWPLGPIGFWESTFGNGEVFQHRIATLLAFALGVLEIRARTNPKARQLRYLFPILCAFGGILLLTHAHAEFELKSEYLIQSTHTAMGLLSVIVASGRWLELRLAETDERYTVGGVLEGKIAGFIGIVAMFLIGLILMVYREPLF